MSAPDDVAEAFVEADPGLSRASVAVHYDDKRLRRCASVLNEYFHDCAEVVRRSCRRDKYNAAVRGGWRADWLIQNESVSGTDAF